MAIKKEGIQSYKSDIYNVDGFAVLVTPWYLNEDFLLFTKDLT